MNTNTNNQQQQQQRQQRQHLHPNPDYIRIGLRIYHYRTLRGYNQQTLAKKIGISLTHMSHIETGTARLSLPLLLALAKALQVSTDDILLPAPAASSPEQAGLVTRLLSDCTPEQANMLLDILRAAKGAIVREPSDK